MKPVTEWLVLLRDEGYRWMTVKTETKGEAAELAKEAIGPGTGVVTAVPREDFLGVQDLPGNHPETGVGPNYLVLASTSYRSEDESFTGYVMYRVHARTADEAQHKVVEASYFPNPLNVVIPEDEYLTDGVAPDLV
jgi:hypothetical protein